MPPGMLLGCWLDQGWLFKFQGTILCLDWVSVVSVIIFVSASSFLKTKTISRVRLAMFLKTSSTVGLISETM